MVWQQLFIEKEVLATKLLAVPTLLYLMVHSLFSFTIYQISYIIHYFDFNEENFFHHFQILFFPQSKSTILRAQSKLQYLLNLANLKILYYHHVYCFYTKGQKYPPVILFPCIAIIRDHSYIYYFIYFTVQALYFKIVDFAPQKSFG